MTVSAGSETGNTAPMTDCAVGILGMNDGGEILSNNHVMALNSDGSIGDPISLNG